MGALLCGQWAPSVQTTSGAQSERCQSHSKHSTLVLHELRYPILGTLFCVMITSIRAPGTWVYPDIRVSPGCRHGAATIHVSAPNTRRASRSHPLLRPPRPFPVFQVEIKISIKIIPPGSGLKPKLLKDNDGLDPPSGPRGEGQGKNKKTSFKMTGFILGIQICEGPGCAARHHTSQPL